MSATRRRFATIPATATPGRTTPAVALLLFVLECRAGISGLLCRPTASQHIFDDGLRALRVFVAS
jgi:hypothetical protein